MERELGERYVCVGGCVCTLDDVECGVQADVVGEVQRPLAVVGDG